MPLKKVRGSHKAFAEFRSLFESTSTDSPNLKIGIAHAAAPERLKALRELVEARAPACADRDRDDARRRRRHARRPGDRRLLLVRRRRVALVVDAVAVRDRRCRSAARVVVRGVVCGDGDGSSAIGLSWPTGSCGRRRSEEHALDADDRDERGDDRRDRPSHAANSRRRLREPPWRGSRRARRGARPSRSRVAGGERVLVAFELEGVPGSCMTDVLQPEAELIRPEVRRVVVRLVDADDRGSRPRGPARRRSSSARHGCASLPTRATRRRRRRTRRRSPGRSGRSCRPRRRSPDAADADDDHVGGDAVAVGEPYASDACRARRSRRPRRPGGGRRRARDSATRAASRLRGRARARAASRQARRRSPSQRCQRASTRPRRRRSRRRRRRPATIARGRPAGRATSSSVRRWWTPAGPASRRARTPVATTSESQTTSSRATSAVAPVRDRSRRRGSRERARFPARPRSRSGRSPISVRTPARRSFESAGRS